MSGLTAIAQRLGKMAYSFSNKITYLSHLAVTNSSTSQYRMVNNSSDNGKFDVDTQVSVTHDEASFSSMLRHSKLFQMGHYEGKIVEGVIQKVVGEDLYVDFGGKFFCVCPKPQSKNLRKFVRGQKVRVCLQELELSTRFLGATKDLTLCEADGYLVGAIVKVDQIQK